MSQGDVILAFQFLGLLMAVSFVWVIFVFGLVRFVDFLVGNKKERS